MVKKVTKKMKKPEKKINKVDIKCNTKNSGCGSCGYGLGILGALVYYLSTATGFWHGMLGFLKSLVWPVFLVYEVLKFVGA